MQRAGVIVGVPWCSAWFEPDVDGFIDASATWRDSGVAGGHELYWAALEAWDDRSPSRSIVRFANSWGLVGRSRLRSPAPVYIRGTQAADRRETSRQGWQSAELSNAVGGHQVLEALGDALLQDVDHLLPKAEWQARIEFGMR
jgi:hypothetical protein